MNMDDYGESDKLPTTAQLLYLFYREICGRSEEDECYWSQEAIAKALGISIRTVENNTRILKAHDLIEVKKQKKGKQYASNVVTMTDLDIYDDYWSTKWVEHQEGKSEKLDEEIGEQLIEHEAETDEAFSDIEE